MEEKNLRNRFDLGVRSSMETATVSAREIALSEKRLAAAQKSFEIVQAGYAEGRNSVTDLIDAQNDKVSSEHAAASAKYQFVLDFLEMERAIGRFHFLDSLEEKQAFLDRLHHFMATVRSQ
jgi:outer membrane protein TolC